MLKRLIGISLMGWLMTTIALPALAQSTVEQRVETRMKVWTEHLKLSTSQQDRIRAILLERERQWDRDHAQIQAATPADRQRLRDEQRTHMQSYRDKLHAILTPDQQKTALRLREMRAGTGRMHPKAGIGRRQHGPR